MSAKKGCTGRAYTAEAKAKKSAAGRARWGEPSPGSFAPGPPGHPPTSMDEPLETIADHDRQIGRPVTWPDALKRLQMIEQAVINEKREVELDEAKVKRDLARSRLIPADEARSAMRDLAAVLLSHVPVIVDAALALVPVEAQPTARLKLDAAVQEFRRRAEAEASK